RAIPPGCLPRAVMVGVMAAFFAASPAGSALCYVLGRTINVYLGWRWAFYLVTPPGLLLGLICFFQRDPRARAGAQLRQKRADLKDYLKLAKTRSFVLNTFAQTAFTFALGGIAFWMPAYLQLRQQPASSRVL